MKSQCNMVLVFNDRYFERLATSSRLKLAQGLNKCSESAKILQTFHFPKQSQTMTASMVRVWWYLVPFHPRSGWKAHLPRCMTCITSKPCIPVLRAQPVHTWPASCDKNGSDFLIKVNEFTAKLKLGTKCQHKFGVS